jgi:protease-4
MADAKLASSLIRMRQRRTGPLILELDLTDGITEGPPADPLSALLTMRRTRLQDLLDGLKRAAADDRVRVLVVKVGGSGIGLAKVQELRAAIGDFRQSGKLAVAWSESFGDFVHGNVPYYLATGFDRIYLQPSGTLGLTGVAVEQVFLHGALEKLGIDFQTARRHEYKSAPDQLTESGFTGPAREAAARLAESVTEQLAGAIAAGRDLPVAQVTDLLARGPFLAQDALAEGLVDGLMYRDEVYDQVRKEAGPDATLLYLQRYQRTQSLSDWAAASRAWRPGSMTGSSRRSTRTAPSGTGAAAGADLAAAGWAQTRWRRRCGRRRPTKGRAPSCCGSTVPAARTRRPT